MPEVVDYQNATLLTALYERYAQSAARKQPGLQLFEARFGHGYIDEGKTPPMFQSVPADLSVVPNEFYSIELTDEDLTCSDGRIIIRCRFPIGSVNEAKKFSMVGIYDQLGTLVAVMQDLPDWLTPTDEHTVYAYLDFPHLGETPPEAL